MKNTVVHKYGGSSLATDQQLRAVAERVAAARRSHPLVVVVSARGDGTDELLALADRLNPRAPAREIDQLLATAETSSAAQLAMVLRRLGVPAVSLTGGQAGIQVSEPHGEGRIVEVDTTRLRAVLRDGGVPVVSGYQGTGPEGDVVTLGRGGSDTTAVALAAALRAQRCEIYTDVDGVYTADPRLVPAARLLRHVDAQVMTEMARTGAKVLHPRAVELAQQRDVEVHVRNSHAEQHGTVVTKGLHAMESPGSVVAVTHDTATTEVSLSFGPEDGRALPEILERLAAAGVETDLLTQVSHREDRLVRFTVPDRHLATVREVLRTSAPDSEDTLRIDQTLGKASIVTTSPNAGFLHSARMLHALAAADIPSAGVFTAQLRTSVLVPRARLVEAVRTLHEEFGLADLDTPASPEPQRPAAPGVR